MKKHFFILIIIFLITSVAQAQSLFDRWSIKAGLNWASPTVIDNNITYGVSSATGYQVEVAKLLPMTDEFGIQLSGGLIQMSAYLRDDRDFDFNEQLSVSYWFLQAGLKGEKAVGKFKPFGTVNVRGGRLFDDNLQAILFLPSRETFDYGLVFSVGTEYALTKVHPFVEANYYHGLLDIVSSSYIDGTGQLFESEINNRTWAFLVGIRF